MAAELELRPLLESDDRTGFSCGQGDLDRYFQHFAGQNQFRHQLSVTYVATANDVIVGFATVSGGSIERETLPAVKKRPPAYPLPVLRLARMGVDVRAQKLGVGRALLRYVLDLAVRQRDAVGCVGVLTDAKLEAVGFYARYGFSALGELREGALAGEPVAMFLPMATLAATLA